MNGDFIVDRLVSFENERRAIEGTEKRNGNFGVVDRVDFVRKGD